MNIYSSNEGNASSVDQELLWLWAEDYFAGRRLSRINGESASDYSRYNKTTELFYKSTCTAGRDELTTVAWDEDNKQITLKITRAMVAAREESYKSRAASAAYIRPSLY